MSAESAQPGRERHGEVPDSDHRVRNHRARPCARVARRSWQPSGDRRMCRHPSRRPPRIRRVLRHRARTTLRRLSANARRRAARHRGRLFLAPATRRDDHRRGGAQAEGDHLSEADGPEPWRSGRHAYRVRAERRQSLYRVPASTSRHMGPCAATHRRGRHRQGPTSRHR